MAEHEKMGRAEMIKLIENDRDEKQNLDESCQGLIKDILAEAEKKGIVLDANLNPVDTRENSIEQE